MLTNKNVTSLLLVALIAAATPAQADPITSIKNLLARMQSNAIARQFTAKRVAVTTIGIAAGLGLWWLLKNRQANSAVQQEFQIKTVQEKENVTIPWGVAQFQNVNEYHYAVKTGPRYDIFLVCDHNRKFPEGKKQNLFSDILVDGYRASDKPHDVIIPPLVEYIAEAIDKGLPVNDALQKTFAATEQLLQETFGYKNNIGAKATVTVIDKQAQKISVATLGDIRAVVLGTDSILQGVSHKVVYLDQDKQEQNRVYKALNNYTCLRTKKIQEIKDDMQNKNLLLGLPVTRVLGEFAAKKEMPNVIIAWPDVPRTLTKDDISKHNYLVIATDSLWQEIDPKELRYIMPLPLPTESKKKLRESLCDAEKCALNKMLSNGSDNTIRSYAKNMLDLALFRVVREKKRMIDMTVMLIDMRQLHNEKK